MESEEISYDCHHGCLSGGKPLVGGRGGEAWTSRVPYCFRSCS